MHQKKLWIKKSTSSVLIFPNFLHTHGRRTSYRHEPVRKNDGFVPVRLSNALTGEEHLIASVFVPDVKNSSFRVDPASTWDRSDRYIMFNGFEDNTLCVYIADLHPIIYNKKIRKKARP